MNLAWCQNEKKRVLLLIMGYTKTHAITLKIHDKKQLLTDREIEKIKSMADKLKKMSIKEKIDEIKSAIGLRTYRTYKLSNLKILQQYNIKST